MPRHHMINSVKVPFTAAEELVKDAEIKIWESKASAREMTDIRDRRNSLLMETDWMGFSDVTISDEWKIYRQALRDIPASNTVYADVTWPTKP